MKRWSYTVLGKATLFISCIIMAILFAASCGLGAFLLISADESGANYYTQSEEAIKQTVVAHEVEWRAYAAARNYLFSQELEEGNEASYYIEENGNLEFRLYDESGKEIARSRGASDDMNWAYRNDVIWSIPEIYTDTDEQDTPDAASIERYSIEAAIRPDVPAFDDLYLGLQLVHLAYSMRYLLYVTGIGSLLIMIGLFITLMCAAGHRPEDEGVSASPLQIIPIDVLLGTYGIVGVSAIVWIAEDMSGSWLTILAAMGATLLALGVIGLVLCMEIATRIKLKNVIRSSLCGRIAVLAWKSTRWVIRGVVWCVRAIPAVWKAALLVCAAAFMSLSALAMQSVFLWAVIWVCCGAAVVWFARNLQTLQKACEALAEGNLEYRTDTSHMRWSMKEQGENLNRIAVGTTIAVEERVRSERMKAELITNVSHDIKTPLTSIINYAALIGNEPADSGKIQEYSEVLVRQSERLKRLIEDLVEASKASSGNLEVHLAPCDATVFLVQASGEYEEKLKKAQLELVVSQLDKELFIMADGRRMWRVFDNLMSNICKYALPGTRVYLSIEQQDGNAVVTFKNTSRDALNISEEELMERFVRGDRSRNTEGNGLGLSIARSMAELQGGALKLLIDGDLFKAILTFPLIQ